MTKNDHNRYKKYHKYFGKIYKITNKKLLQWVLINKNPMKVLTIMGFLL